jgi:hypothetical protein
MGVKTSRTSFLCGTRGTRQALNYRVIIRPLNSFRISLPIKNPGCTSFILIAINIGCNSTSIQYVLEIFFTKLFFSEVIKVELDSLPIKDHTLESVTSFTVCQVQKIICLNSVSKTEPISMEIIGVGYV